MPNYSPDSDLLKEIRQNYDYQLAQWKDIREEAKKDMRFVAGDPWSQSERDERSGANRICLNTDEINQYENQLINDVRQNKRAVQVNPKGNGANDLTARMRGDKIRQIEYQSKAQAAYRTAFEGAVQRSYGYWGYKTQYCSDSSFDQEIAIVRIPNPDTILLDWDAKEADCSDGMCAFEIDTMRVEDFKRKWKNADITSFGAYKEMAPAWIGEDRVQIAKYHKVEITSKTLLQFANGQTGCLQDFQGAKLRKYASGDGQPGKQLLCLPSAEELIVLRTRKSEERKVCQYITNGIEILEETDWPGKWIPIVPCFGKEIWVDDGNGAKRHLISLTRLARDPQMLLAYIRTCQAEMVGQAPKTVWTGYEGQFATNTDWRNLHKLPTAFAEFKATTPESEAANNQQILPPPQRVQFDASAVMGLEQFAQSARAAIQSAMGGTGMLNGMFAKGNPESGRAFEKLDQQESQSNFHFIDNYDLALEFGGRIMDNLLGPVYDTPRQESFRKADGTHYVAPINPIHPATGENVLQIPGPNGQPIPAFHTDQGDHEVTISTGPSNDSQRAEAQDFGETLLKTVPGIAPAILDLLIRLRNLGPLGDEMADRVKQMFQQGQQQVPPQVQMQIQKLTAMVQQLTMEKRAKLIEIQGKMQLEQQKQAGKNWQVTQEQSVDLQKTRMNNEAMIQQALVKLGQATQADQIAAQLEQLITLWEQQHEFAMGSAQAAHEHSLADKEHQQAMEQAQQSAALNPPPEPAGPQSPGQPG